MTFQTTFAFWLLLVASTASLAQQVDRCLEWGLKHGTSEYADCRIKLLQAERGIANPRTPPQQERPADRVRTEEEKEQDFESCNLWVGAQPNPYAEKYQRLKRASDGPSPTSRYSGRIGNEQFEGEAYQDDSDLLAEGMVGFRLYKLEEEAKAYALQLMNQCMERKGWRRQQ